MKVDVKQIQSGEDEVIVRYKDLTPPIRRILDAIETPSSRLIGKTDGETVTIDPKSILYIESVDDRVYAYTADEVARLEGSLTGIIEKLNDIRFFRCSKSMIINIDKVQRLRSLSSNRIDATMEGGEHILISRTYASDFRKLLKDHHMSRGNQARTDK